MSFRASDHRDDRRKAPRRKGSKSLRLFSAPKKNLNLGVHPVANSVGGGCYDRCVNEASSHLSEGHLGALVAAAFMLQWPLPRERDEAVCHGTVRAVESLLVRVGRCRGALDVRIGEGLDALGTGDRVIRLGFSGTGDYARERLGIAASTAQKMARLARELRSRPLLRAAVREGRVSTSAAEAVIKVAQGEAEAFWVARARTESVRALEAAAKEPGRLESAEDERWMRLCAGVPAEGRPVLDEAMELAGKATCVTVPKWQRLQGMAEEYLGAHEAPEHGAGVDRLVSDSAGELLESAKEWLEKESVRWAFLDQVGPVAAPGPSLDGETDPWRIDAELRRLADRRARWDEVFGHLAMLFRAMDGWRRLGFASFEHHCKERLGMGARAVEQRAALERRLYELPSLRQAMVERRLSYEKARLIARYADERSVESWIERAGQVPCVQLRRELQGQQETQMSARGEFDVWVPRRVGGLLALAFGAARKAAGRWLSPGECLVKIAEHFIEVWKPMLAERNTVQKQVLARDRGLCQVPWCSRAAAHVHHIEFRSAGGSDDPSNLVSFCAVHHLRGVHMGRLRVSGTAPDRLRWELGAGAGAPPLAEIGSAPAGVP